MKTALNWRQLKDALAKAETEEQLLAILKQEQEGSRKPRPTFLNLIYGRYSTVRAQRERTAIMSGGSL